MGGLHRLGLGPAHRLHRQVHQVQASAVRHPGGPDLLRRLVLALGRRHHVLVGYPGLPPIAKVCTLSTLSSADCISGISLNEALQVRLYSVRRRGWVG